MSKGLIEMYSIEMQKVRHVALRDMRKRLLLLSAFLGVLLFAGEFKHVIELALVIFALECITYGCFIYEKRYKGTPPRWYTIFAITLNCVMSFAYMLPGILLAKHSDIAFICLGVIWTCGVFMHISNSFGALPAYTTTVLVPVCAGAVFMSYAIFQNEPTSTTATGILALVLGLALLVGYIVENVVQKTSLQRRLASTSQALVERELELSVSRQQLMDAVEGMHDGFVYFDRHGKLLLANRRFRELYDRSLDAISAGNTYETILRVGLNNNQFETAKSPKEEWLMKQLEVVDSADGAIQVLFDGRIIQALQRKTTDGGQVGLHIDVTGLTRAREAAETASKVKSQFLANMSHEIRTPLTAVLGMADLLDATDLEHHQRELLTTIRTAGWGLLALLNDILDLARVETGKLSLENREFNLRDVISQIEAVHGSVASTKGIEFSTDFRIEHSAIRKGDSARISQILNNIVGNAIKFTDYGRVSLEVEAADDDYVRFIVTDTGIGMTSSQVERMFGVFEQADSDISRRYGGSGLGMAIVKSLIELLDGRIEVNSVLSEGTRIVVCVFLPSGNNQTALIDTAAQNRQIATSDSERTVPKEGIRILVADDSAANRKIIGTFLKSFGFIPDYANDGHQACDCLRRARYDLVLLDISMPGMSGLDVLSTVAEDAQNFGTRLPYMVAATANVMTDQVAAYLKHGFDDVLAKPFQRRALQEVLQKARCFTEEL